MMRSPERGSDRGEVSMQTLIVLPVTLTVLLVGIHFVQLIHGGHVAVAAASRGAHVASTVQNDGSGAGSVFEVVRSMARDLGSTLEGAPVVEMDADSVTVTVGVVFDGAVPFLPAHIRRSVTVPRERFMTEDER